MNEDTFDLVIYCNGGSLGDKVFEVKSANYECDGCLLIVDQGEDSQFVFNMDFVKYFTAERSEDE